MIRKYYDLKLSGYSGLILKAGGDREALSRGEMFQEYKKDIVSDVHILTEDAIQNIIEKESEEYKKGFRKFGEVYLGFLEECQRYKLAKDKPNLMEEAKQKAEAEILSRTEGKYTTQ